MDKSEVNINLWKRIAQISGIFAFVISIILIVNYAQYKRLDPVNTELINSLVERLNDNPSDSLLRDQIRTVDLLSRKAYFTNQWQVRTGGYLLLLSIAVLVIAIQIIKSNSTKELVIGENNDAFLEQKSARKWISISGVILVSIALLLAFFTHNDLSQEFTVASVEKSADPASGQTQVEEKQPVKEIKEAPVPTEELTLNADDKKVEQPNEVSNTQNHIVDKKPTKEVALEKEELIAEKVEGLTEFPSEIEILNNHPSFRGPGGNGISYRKNIPISWDATSGDNLVWKVEIPLHGYNSPIIWEDKIFVSGANSAQREVYCIDRNSGKILWTGEVKDIEGSPATSPEVTEDTGQAAPSLTTDGRRVYAIFANGDIIAFDMDGNRVWARNLGDPNNHYGHSSSLMLYQNVLIVQYDIKKAPKVMGLDFSTGETLWETPRNVKVSWASPVVVNTGNRTEVILFAEPSVDSYDPLTGKLNWSVDCTYGEVGPSVAYADGLVFAVNEYAKLVAIKTGENPEILWESTDYMSDVPSPVATEELMFMATSYGVYLCYDAKTGEILWEQENDNGFYSSPMMVEGKIYLMDMQGIMHIFEASREYVPLGDCPLGEDGMTTPAFADGKIYIRGNKHLFCFGK
ncbi:MAG: hypothetical protein C0598_02910 [Marinilabiliales bacterium]|nr:MAG: hypothetical protein C0598_02910 [Marinilabiliales bacterium]